MQKITTKKNKKKIIEQAEEQKEKRPICYKLPPRKIPNNRNVWGFDIETDPFDKSKFVLAIITNGEIVYRCESPQDVASMLLSKKELRSAVLVATNLSFDYFGTFLNVEELQPFLTFSERNGTLYHAKFQQDAQHYVEFRDTLRYVGFSVEEIGKRAKRPKLLDPRLRIDVDGNPITKNGLRQYTWGVPTTKEQWDTLFLYCENDAYLSYWFYLHVITKWCDEHHIEVKSTMASIALTHFRTNFLQYSLITNPHEVNQFIFKSYYGGRTEAFERGLVEDVNVYDFNSLYPSVMAENEYPNPSFYQEKEQCCYADIFDFHGCMYIEGVMPEQQYPPLPVKTTEKLVFPCGIIKGVYTMIDLRYAIKECGFRITKIGHGVLYESPFYPFTAFVSAMYQERVVLKQQNDVMEIMAKAVMNSLYGKFAFRYQENDAITHKNEITADTYLENDLVEQTENEYYYRVATSNNAIVPNTVFPILSSYTTTYGRIKLHREMKSNGHVVYCDTDSLFVRDCDSKKIETASTLGALKLENVKKTGSRLPIKHMLVVRPKLYEIIFEDGKEKIKAKGMKSLKTSFDFHRALGQKVIREIRTMKLRQAINLKRGDKYYGIQINEFYTVQKSINTEDDKRDWIGQKFSMTECQQSKPKIFTEKDYQEENK